MENFPQLSEQIRQDFEARTMARDQALTQARQLTRYSAHTIRAIHRSETESANENLSMAKELVETLKKDLEAYPDLFAAGYTQDAIKEYAEASITVALILNQPLPMPDGLGISMATYTNGLAETTGELRRRCMDLLRKGYSGEAERLLTCMDEIYSLLVTLDFPDAITNGLRRHTDLVRGIVERTRADLTISLREYELKQAMDALLKRLPPGQGEDAHDSSL